MELREGLMTNSELAAWFGISESTFKNNKKKKLEELKEYASFEELKGKVNVIKVYFPQYIKKSKNFKSVKEATKKEWSDDGLDTCKLVSKRIMARNMIKLSNETIYAYTCKSRGELWGKPFGSEGEIGYCVYELCKEVDGKCVEFTEEENKIKKELLRKYFGTTEEKTVLVHEMVKSGEISSEEAWDVYAEMLNLTGNYMAFMNELRDVLGVEKIVRGTKVTTNGFLDKSI